MIAGFMSTVAKRITFSKSVNSLMNLLTPLPLALLIRVVKLHRCELHLNNHSFVNYGQDTARRY